MEKRFYEIVGELAGLIFGGFCLAALAVLGYQTIIFLMDGAWPKLSFLVVIEYISPEWARHPESWKGLHKLLDMPLFFGLFVSAIFISTLFGLAGLMIGDNIWGKD
jgi:hypothetical protein